MVKNFHAKTVDWKNRGLDATYVQGYADRNPPTYFENKFAEIRKGPSTATNLYQ
jgi:hypothetical protein